MRKFPSMVLAALAISLLCACAHPSDQTRLLLPINGSATDTEIESSVQKLQQDDVINALSRARHFAGAKRSQKDRDQFQTKIDNFKNHVLEVHSAVIHSKADGATREEWHKQDEILAKRIDSIQRSEDRVNRMADEDENKHKKE